MRVRPSPALAVAFIALFAAMGGIGYSAVKVERNGFRTRILRTCHLGALKGSVTVKTSTLVPDQQNVVPGFDCANRADDAVKVERNGIGVYTVDFAYNDADVAIAASAGTNTVAAATRVVPGEFLVKTWRNSDGFFVDNTSFTLIAF